MPPDHGTELIETVLKYGHGLLYVFPTEDSGGYPFTYSYGRALKGRPDWLLTVPLDPETAKGVLNSAVAADDLFPFKHGHISNEVLVGYPVMAMEADLHVGQMYAAENFASCWAMQLLLPDKAGRFPTHPEYDHVGLPQPLCLKDADG